MGGYFSLPAGDYAATTWPVEWPDDASEQAIERALGTEAMQSRARTAHLLRGSIVMALVLTLALGSSTYRTLSDHTSFPIWSPYVSALVASLVVAIVALLRSSRRFDREHRVDEIVRNFPSFVIFLERLSD
jgi:hypothetical protein